MNVYESFLFFCCSVQWEVRDFRVNFSGQIARHMALVLGAVEQFHWRLRPTVLLGKSVAVLTVLSEGSSPDDILVIPTTRLG
jgi:hypothetical protein